MPRSVSDDIVTQSPRSMLVSDGSTTDIGQTTPRSSSPAPSVSISKGDNDSEVQTPRSDAESEGTSPLDESQCQDQDEYYAFLRELAGSFEATSEDDDESEVSSEEGTEDEEEAPAGRKRSSAWSPESDCPDEDDGSPASPHLPVHTKAQQGEAQNKDSVKGFNSRASGNMQPKGGLQDRRFTPAPRGQVQGPVLGPMLGPMLGTMTVAACWQQSRGEATGGWRRPAVGWSAGQPPVSCSPATPSMAPSGGTTPGDRPSMKPMKPMVSPRNDHRRPVVDDYDVIQATEQYAEQRPGTRAEQRREDLEAAIQLRTHQAKKLLGVAQRECSDPEIRSHYARIRTEIMAEVRALESELLSLDEATVETIPTVQEHLFRRCGSTETLAAPLEGGRPRSVAVQ